MVQARVGGINLKGVKNGDRIAGVLNTNPRTEIDNHSHYVLLLGGGLWFQVA